MDEPSDFIEKSESARADLLAQATRAAAEGVAIGFGGSVEQPRYQLLPLSKAPPEVVRDAERITIDRARKQWADLRAALRFFDVKFVLQGERRGGQRRELAVLQRHPGYRPIRVEDWVKNYRTRIGGSIDLEHTVADLVRRVASLEDDKG